MATKKIVLCDTSVLIDYYNGNEGLIKILDKIEYPNIAINYVVYAEAIYGSLNKSDFKKWTTFLDKLVYLECDEEINAIALDLLKKFVLSHKMHIADSVIAATAIYYKLPLFTLNKKDFQFIPNLLLYNY